MREKKEIGDFVIAVDAYGPVLTRKDSDQHCFEFIDVHHAPDAAHEEMLAAAEELQAEYLKELLQPRVEIFSLEEVVKALKQTGGVTFPDQEPSVCHMPDLSAVFDDLNTGMPIDEADVGSDTASEKDAFDFGDEPSPEKTDEAAAKPVYPQMPPELAEANGPGARSGEATQARKSFDQVSDKAHGGTAALDTADEIGADGHSDGSFRMEQLLGRSFDPESYLQVATAYQAMMRTRRARLGRPPMKLSTDYLSSDETVRVQRLRSLYEDPRGAERPLVIADDAMIARIEAVGRLSPQFAGLIGLYVRAGRLSALTRTAFHVPPVVLVGPPGTGKSFTVQRLSAAIHGGKDFHRFSMNLVSDSGMLFGHEQSWRGSKAGLLTSALIDSETASPVFYIDEIDKLQSTSSAQEDPFIPLLTLLEPENAKAARDSYLALDFDLSHVLVIATANDVSCLSAPMRDRFLILETKSPTQKQRAVIVRNMLFESTKAYRRRIALPDETVIEALAVYHPRRITKIIGLALGFMAAEDRFALSIEDVEAAAALLEPAEKPGIGFTATVG